MDFTNTFAEEAPTESAPETVETITDVAPDTAIETPETVETAPVDDDFEALWNEEVAPADSDEVPAFALPENDDDLNEYNGFPLSQQLAQTRAYARELAQRDEEVRAAQEQYAKFGKPEEIERALNFNRGFFTPLTNEAGEVVINPQTGVPIYSAKPALEQLAASSPSRITQVLHDINQMQTESGESFLVDFLVRGLGKDPQDLQDFFEGKLVRPEAPEPPAGRLTAADRDYVKEVLGETAVAPYEKYIHPIHGEDFFTLPVDKQDALIKDATERMQVAERLEQLDNQAREQQQRAQQAEQMEMQQLQSSIQTAAQTRAAETRTQTLSTIVDRLASKVQFSADENQNKTQLGIIKAVLGATLDADLSPLVSELVAPMGVTLDPNFHKTVESIGNKIGEVERLTAFQTNPKLAQYRDDQALAVAKEALRQQVEGAERTLNGIALKIAKSLGATAKQQSDALRAAANNAKGRPQVRGNATNGQAFTPSFAPLSADSFNYVES